MARKRSRLADFCVYVVVRSVVAILQILTWPATCQFARGLAWLIYHANRRHRLVALDNLRQAFPGKYSEEELDQLVRKVYLHLCLLMMEMIHLGRVLKVSNWRQHLIYANPDDCRRLLDIMLSDRPVLLVAGHAGNWEVTNYTFGLLGFQMNAIARPIDNPYLDAWIKRFRQSTGQRILTKNGDFERIEEVLAAGGVLGMLADQDGGQRGVYVNFFGRLASTHKAAALLALEHNTPMIVGAIARRSENMQFVVHIEDVIDPEDFAGRSDAVAAITQRFTSAIEHFVRRYPEQYFWLHRRWKHQPKIKQPRKAA